MSRTRIGVSIAAAVVVVAVALVALGALAAPHPVTSRSEPTASPSATAAPSATPAPSASTSPAATASAAPTPAPTPTPGPSLVVGALDGLPTTAAAAAQHPIAVMVDDLRAARPQSGFSAASIVWQAPAEGGIPRYMMIFNERMPRSVGPIRSSRLYFIAWASEWRSVYVHVGGSPQALATLRAKGHGQLVYNADGYIYEGRYLFRITSRVPPHNEYTDGPHLRSLANVVGGRDRPLKPVWTFAPDAPLAARPTGGSIDVSYPYNHIHYAYDRASNTYRRSVVGEKAQVDAATGTRVAPKNVVTIVMHFGPLNDGHPEKKRLEADFVGSGRAWVSRNGVTTRATWRKASIGAPTLLFDGAGHPITLTAGQTFVQVVPSASAVRFVAGRAPPPPAAASEPPARRPGVE
jgi:Protein of unknown function (DUF3048) N-terminal domain/Protein of unknown function (DUF3048) C-terminal domain